MQKLDDTQIESKLKEFEAWSYDEEAGKVISGFEFDNFQESMDFAQAVGDVAEELNHHPDILIHEYKFVTIFTSTHDVKGISEKDFELIQKIEDELVKTEGEEE